VLLKILVLLDVALWEGTMIPWSIHMFCPSNRASNPGRMELNILNVLSKDSVLFLIAVCSPPSSA